MKMLLRSRFCLYLVIIFSLPLRREFVSPANDDAKDPLVANIITKFYTSSLSRKKHVTSVRETEMNLYSKIFYLMKACVQTNDVLYKTLFTTPCGLFEHKHSRRWAVDIKVYGSYHINLTITSFILQAVQGHCIIEKLTLRYNDKVVHYCGHQADWSLIIHGQYLNVEYVLDKDIPLVDGLRESRFQISYQIFRLGTSRIKVEEWLQAEDLNSPMHPELPNNYRGRKKKIPSKVKGETKYTFDYKFQAVRIDTEHKLYVTVGYRNAIKFTSLRHLRFRCGKIKIFAGPHEECPEITGDVRQIYDSFIALIVARTTIYTRCSFSTQISFSVEEPNTYKFIRGQTWVKGKKTLGYWQTLSHVIDLPNTSGRYSCSSRTTLMCRYFLKEPIYNFYVKLSNLRVYGPDPRGCLYRGIIIFWMEPIFKFPSLHLCDEFHLASILGLDDINTRIVKAMRIVFYDFNSQASFKSLKVTLKIHRTDKNAYHLTCDDQIFSLGSLSDKSATALYFTRNLTNRRDCSINFVPNTKIQESFSVRTNFTRSKLTYCADKRYMSKSMVIHEPTNITFNTNCISFVMIVQSRIGFFKSSYNILFNQISSSIYLPFFDNENYRFKRTTLQTAMTSAFLNTDFVVPHYSLHQLDGTLMGFQARAIGHKCNIGLSYEYFLFHEDIDFRKTALKGGLALMGHHTGEISLHPNQPVFIRSLQLSRLSYLVFRLHKKIEQTTNCSLEIKRSTFSTHSLLESISEGFKPIEVNSPSKPNTYGQKIPINKISFGSAYTVIWAKQKLSWHKSSSICDEMGLELPTVHTEKDKHLLLKLLLGWQQYDNFFTQIDAPGKIYSTSFLWLGLKNHERFWTDGTPSWYPRHIFNSPHNILIRKMSDLSYPCSNMSISPRNYTRQTYREHLDPSCTGLLFDTMRHSFSWQTMPCNKSLPLETLICKSKGLGTEGTLSMTSMTVVYIGAYFKNHFQWLRDAELARQVTSQHAKQCSCTTSQCVTPVEPWNQEYILKVLDVICDLLPENHIKINFYFRVWIDEKIKQQNDYSSVKLTRNIINAGLMNCKREFLVFNNTCLKMLKQETQPSSETKIIDFIRKNFLCIDKDYRKSKRRKVTTQVYFREERPFQVEPSSDCLNGYFMCKDGSCVGFHVVFDGYNNCPDGSDEQDSAEVCSIKQQGNLKSVFGSKGDCDKCQSPLCSCSIHFYQCEQGGCIHWHKVCDGKSDCADDSDERMCHYITKHTVKNQVINENVENNLFQNGLIMKEKDIQLHIDHPFMTRYKAKCSLTTMKSWTYEFHKNKVDDELSIDYLNENLLHCNCHTNMMFHYTDLCKYDIDDEGNLLHCKSGEHLVHCQNVQCPGRYKCPGSYCIATSKLCNSIIDCPRGVDEINCSHNQTFTCPGFYRCNDLSCLHTDMLCDGHPDCSSGEDEFHCLPKQQLCKGTKASAICRGLTELRTVQEVKHLVIRQIDDIPWVDVDIFYIDSILYLNVSHNYLKEWFPVITMEALRILDISFNRIQTLSKDLGSRMPFIFKIFAQNNRITSLETDLNTLTHPIASIDFAFNLLIVVDFSYFTAVNQIRISNNKITTILLPLNLSLTKTSEIDLQNNPIKNIFNARPQNKQYNITTENKFACCIVSDLVCEPTIRNLCGFLYDVTYDIVLQATVLFCLCFPAHIYLFKKRMNNIHSSNIPLLHLNMIGMILLASILMSVLEPWLFGTYNIPTPWSYGNLWCLVAAHFQAAACLAYLPFIGLSLYGLHYSTTSWRTVTKKRLHLMSAAIWIITLFLVILVYWASMIKIYYPAPPICSLFTSVSRSKNFPTFQYVFLLFSTLFFLGDIFYICLVVSHLNESQKQVKTLAGILSKTRNKKKIDIICFLLILPLSFYIPLLYVIILGMKRQESLLTHVIIMYSSVALCLLDLVRIPLMKLRKEVKTVDKQRG